MKIDYRHFTVGVYVEQLLWDEAALLFGREPPGNLPLGAEPSALTGRWVRVSVGTS